MKSQSKYPVKCLGHGQDESGSWYVEIGIKDSTSQESRIFSMAELALDLNSLWKFLGAAGYIPRHGERREIEQELLSRPSKENFKVLARQGWHGNAFVTPYRTYGHLAQGTRTIRADTVDHDKWVPRGKLKKWQNGIAAICNGNPMLAFAVSLAFIPPLLHLLRLPTVGWSLVGESGLGKSAAAVLAGQCWGGDPERRLGFCETLLKTANSYDKVAQRYRNCFLGLDETNLTKGQTLHDIVHRLAAGDSKETAINDQLPTHNVLLYLMTSNREIEKILRDEGIHFDESLTARLIEIAVEKPEGMLHRLPQGMTAHSFVAKIYAFVAEIYGCPIDRYLERLTHDLQKDSQKLESWLRKRMTSMHRRLRIDGNVSGEERRGQYFCLAYAAARLARRYGVLPWSWKVSSKAVRVAYAAHRKLQKPVAEARDPVSLVREFIAAHRRDFMDVRRVRPELSREQLEAGPGFITDVGHGNRCFAFAISHFHARFKTGDDAEPTLQALRAAGFLKHDKGKLTTKRPIRANKPRDRVYCVREVILGDKEEGRG